MLKEKIANLSENTYEVVRKILIGLTILYLITSPLQGILFIFIIRWYTKARFLYKEENRKEKRKIWNEQFKDNSFDKIFNEYMCYSDFFNEYFEKEFQKRTEKENESKSNTQKESKTNTQNQKRGKSELELALEYFGYINIMDVDMPSLKNKYKRLIVKNHPDNGGNLEETKKINRYYVLLKEKVS